MKHGTFILALVVFASTAARGDDSASPAPAARVDSNSHQAISSPDTSRWIAELGSADYRAREAATQQLIAAGPQVIQPVAKAAQTEDLEVAYRCISVLQSLLESNDPAAQQQADGALESLAAKKATVVANLASDALTVYLSTRQDHAIEQLRRLGAEVSSGIPGTDNQTLSVTINRDWKGHAADFDLLAQLPDLQRLSIHGLRLNAAAVKTIGQLSQLSALDLYGTGVSADAAQQLTAALPGAKIERRNGALLGIGGHADDTPCRVNEVQPHSAAEAADIRLDDEIISFEGRPIHNFKEFTDLVAERYGGDRVKLEIRRGDEVLTKQVTLGQWQ
jgi:PDZ domain